MQAKARGGSGAVKSLVELLRERERAAGWRVPREARRDADVGDEGLALHVRRDAKEQIERRVRLARARTIANGRHVVDARDRGARVGDELGLTVTWHQAGSGMVGPLSRRLRRSYMRATRPLHHVTATSVPPRDSR